MKKITIYTQLTKKQTALLNKLTDEYYFKELALSGLSFVGYLADLLSNWRGNSIDIYCVFIHVNS